MKPHFKVWVVFDEGTKFGDGRAHLLQQIDDLGSMNQAVARIGMSYRTAWGYLRELETACGAHLMERTPGRGAEGGTRLTPEGREFLKRYWAFRKGIETTIDHHFQRAFKRNVKARRSAKAKTRRAKATLPRK
jgi:molybdate transport system regulatory protein